MYTVIGLQPIDLQKDTDEERGNIWLEADVDA